MSPSMSVPRAIAPALSPKTVTFALVQVISFRGVCRGWHEHSLVTTEYPNIILYPIQSQNHVFEADVQSTLLSCLASLGESQRSESVVEIHVDHGRALASDVSSGARTEKVLPSYPSNTLRDYRRSIVFAGASLW